jgi:hypothetical protein
MSGHPMDKKQFNRALLLLLKGVNRGSDSEGYAMLMTSIVAILIFSMLSVYLFSTKLYRSSAGAIVDGGSTFYAAESGMNRRASQAHGKFVGFSQPVGTAPTGGSVAEQMNQCISGGPIEKGTEDFQCVAQDFDYYEQNESARGVGEGVIDTAAKSSNSKYTAYTFIQPNPANPIQKKIPVGENFAGLNMLEYNYRVYATSVRRNDPNAGNGGIAAQTLLQMDFNSRVIPLFQFAAFYENDLEINPSPNMTLNGPVHTNNNLYIAPGNTLDLKGQVTSVKDMYKSLGFVYNYMNSDRLIKLTNGTSIRSLIGVANELIEPAEINNSSGQLRPKVDRLDVPQPGFLSKTGEYYTKADLRVEFRPTDAIPFKIAVAKDGGGTGSTELSDSLRRSLRQPVLVDTQTGEQVLFCQAVPIPSAPLQGLGLNANEINDVSNAIYAAVLAQPNPVPFSSLNTAMTDSGGNTLRTTFQNYLNANTTGQPKKKKAAQLAAARIATLMAATPQELAALRGDCFVSAPFQVLTLNDRREGRNISTLQTNIQSLTAWNRDGKYKDFDGAGNLVDPTDEIGSPVDSAIFNRAASTSGAPAGSFRKLGLAASDHSEGGFVWHFDLNQTDPSYSYASGKSTYGFAFTGGKDLPAPLTIATEQAIYIQGDYNNTDWKPSATMGDTIAILSNACSDANRRISCGDLLDNSGNRTAVQTNGTSLPVATPTTVKAAFLSHTDLTDLTQSPIRYSGGLNNYIRMLENWKDVPLNYTGSFISLGTPTEYSGVYEPGKLGSSNLSDMTNLNTFYYYFPPIRNYTFDTNFNFAERLPPLTPKVVFLQQKVFKRDYDSNR